MNCRDVSLLKCGKLEKKAGERDRECWQEGKGGILQFSKEQFGQDKFPGEDDIWPNIWRRWRGEPAEYLGDEQALLREWHRCTLWGRSRARYVEKWQDGHQGVRRRSEGQQEPDGIGSRVCTKVFRCWMERAGRAWVRSGKVLQRPPHWRKAQVPTMAVNKFHYIEIKTCDLTPSSNMSFLSHLLHLNEWCHHDPNCSGQTFKASVLSILILTYLRPFYQRVWPSLTPKWIPSLTTFLPSLLPASSKSLISDLACCSLLISIPTVYLLQSSQRGQIHYNVNLTMPFPSLKDFQ